MLLREGWPPCSRLVPLSPQRPAGRVWKRGGAVGLLCVHMLQACAGTHLQAG